MKELNNSRQKVYKYDLTSIFFKEKYAHFEKLEIFLYYHRDQFMNIQKK